MGSITKTSLNIIQTNAGNVMHAMKSIDIGFNGFGEAYFSLIDKNAIKAWKRHKKMTLNLIVPFGDVMFVFFDEIKEKFQVETIGVNDYSRLTVPPLIWFGFKGLGNKQNIVLNISNIPHDPNEIENQSLDFLNYDWKVAEK